MSGRPASPSVTGDVSGGIALGRLRRFVQDRRAVSAVEFALLAPVLILFLAAATEMAWFITAHYKVQRAAAVLADLTARTEDISGGDLTDIFAATGQVVAPMDFAGDGRAIISNVENTSGTGARIIWQVTNAGGIAATSHLGAVGATPTLGGTLTVSDGDALIVAEAFLDYRPLLGLIDLDLGQIYARVIQRPRYGSVALAASP